MTAETTLKPATDAIGLDLGTRRLAYGEDDAILYALAVGATAADLELVFERDLRVLPTFGLTLALWAADELGRRGFFSSRNALHAGQRLEMIEPLPPAGELELSGRVAAVWDKGSAAIFDVEVSCEQFRSVGSVFAPGQGGWGGERGSGSRRAPEQPPARRSRSRTSPDQAALYRLTGDKNLIHIDPAAAEAIGAQRPILHGLCTLGFAVRELAGLFGRHPCDLAALECRFVSPVLPGDSLETRAWEPSEPSGPAPFEVAGGEVVALAGGTVAFA